ncbi:1,6-anhydro-N-acetylmuramyl-L-alanine amidase AmpD [Paraburkholderia acidisoli]|uniref:1,6-anhydro-N-acetylmuramyl-L-alanine amidase AmpD n=1 Tax=Paraburkholderia acidisoli TaxID=2571748 RepID=A0A7Z2GJ17_9BURK|nr:1,6-anhydro-N-acetylmuramyl-L-alanine amidase AmpD [Paraburkholderia acidisoli]QGZ62365.1 1,6-anhydro-N-acetylmuramyl-L-alanine amidase AmpD [Paraburkholderia acidisoli]
MSGARGSAAPPPLEVDAHGWVSGARRLPSPNFEARPPGAVPSLVVVHNISLPPDVFGGPEIADLFLNRLDCDAHPYFDAHLRGVRVSAHFVIHRDGALEQFVSCDERAWHAGASNFFGRERCNDFSIGIELEGSDTTPFEAAQYATLAALVTALAKRYPVQALAGHSDIAPGRKTDPGPHFDWPRLQRDTQLDDARFPYRHPADDARDAS